jgi:hypothetical protein
MIRQGNRALVETRFGVAGRVLAGGYRDETEIFAGSAELMHVAAREHGRPGSGGHQSEGGVQAEGRRHGLRLLVNARSVAVARAFVHGARTYDDLGHSSCNRHGGLLQARADGAAAVLDAAEEAQFATSEVALKFDLRVVVHAVAAHAIDIARQEPRVFEGGLGRFDAQAQLAAPGVHRELRGADAHDCGAVAQRVARGHAREPRPRPGRARPSAPRRPGCRCESPGSRRPPGRAWHTLRRAGP